MENKGDLGTMGGNAKTLIESIVLGYYKPETIIINIVKRSAQINIGGKKRKLVFKTK